MPGILVHHTPPERCSGGVAVVIDVLRWSTTCVAALANGAVGVEAFATAEEARSRAAELGALTAGERNAHRIAGFDLGNSPLEVTRERVAGRLLCATTTNGTRALLATRGAPAVFVAGFVNLSATAAAIRALLAPSASPDGRDLPHVHLVCAGSAGHPSAEDSACAAWLATLLARPQAAAASGGVGEPPDLARLAREAPHAITLRDAGYGEDVAFALRLDAIPIVAAAAPAVPNLPCRILHL